MYEPGEVLGVVAPVTTTVVATLPSAGLGMANSLAVSVLAGLLTWGLIYLYQEHRAKRRAKARS